MIYAIVGRPGTGKSYSAVDMVRNFLRKGTDVYSNVPIDESKFWEGNEPKKKGKLFFWKSLAQFRYIENGIVIIDEAGSYFEARNWAKFSLDDRIKFQQHRKQKLDIYLIAQSFARIESSIRQLTATVYQMQKINIFGLVLFIKRGYIPEDIELKTRKSISTSFLFLRPKIANAYDTYATLNLNRPPPENKFKLMSELFTESARPLGRVDSVYATKGGDTHD
jgi:hypothetical protein